MENIKNYVEFAKTFMGLKIEMQEFEGGKELLVKIYEGAYSTNFFAKESTIEATLNKIVKHCEGVMIAEG